MRVLLVDDHGMVRSGLRRILSDAFACVEVGEAGSCAEALRLVRESAWSVLVLDVSLGDGNGLEIVPAIRALRPRLPIVVLSMHGERPFVVRALRSGVQGYLTKDRAPEELLEAIRCVLSGRRYVGEALAVQLAELVSGADLGAGAPHEALSGREYDVLLQLGAGRSVSEIAQALHLSVKTVSTYRTRILQKMGMDTNAQLMRYVIEKGLGS